MVTNLSGGGNPSVQEVVQTPKDSFNSTLESLKKPNSYFYGRLIVIDKGEGPTLKRAGFFTSLWEGFKGFLNKNWTMTNKDLVDAGVADLLLSNLKNYDSSNYDQINIINQLADEVGIRPRQEENSDGSNKGPSIKTRLEKFRAKFKSQESIDRENKKCEALSRLWNKVNPESKSDKNLEGDNPTEIFTTFKNAYTNELKPFAAIVDKMKTVAQALGTVAVPSDVIPLLTNVGKSIVLPVESSLTSVTENAAIFSAELPVGIEVEADNESQIVVERSDQDSEKTVQPEDLEGVGDEYEMISPATTSTESDVPVDTLSSQKIDEDAVKAHLAEQEEIAKMWGKLNPVESDPRTPQLQSTEETPNPGVLKTETLQAPPSELDEDPSKASKEKDIENLEERIKILDEEIASIENQLKEDTLKEKHLERDLDTDRLIDQLNTLKKQNEEKIADLKKTFKMNNPSVPSNTEIEGSTTPEPVPEGQHTFSRWTEKGSSGLNPLSILKSMAFALAFFSRPAGFDPRNPELNTTQITPHENWGVEQPHNQNAGLEPHEYDIGLEVGKEEEYDGPSLELAPNSASLIPSASPTPSDPALALVLRHWNPGEHAWKFIQEKYIQIDVSQGGIDGGQRNEAMGKQLQVVASTQPKQPREPQPPTQKELENVLRSTLYDLPKVSAEDLSDTSTVSGVSQTPSGELSSAGPRSNDDLGLVQWEPFEEAFYDLHPKKTDEISGGKELAEYIDADELPNTSSYSGVSQAPSEELNSSKSEEARDLIPQWSTYKEDLSLEKTGRFSEIRKEKFGSEETSENIDADEPPNLVEDLPSRNTNKSTDEVPVSPDPASKIASSQGNLLMFMIGSIAIITERVFGINALKKKIFNNIKRQQESSLQNPPLRDPPCIIEELKKVDMANDVERQQVNSKKQNQHLEEKPLYRPGYFAAINNLEQYQDISFAYTGEIRVIDSSECFYFDGSENSLTQLKEKAPYLFGDKPSLTLFNGEKIEIIPGDFFVPVTLDSLPNEAIYLPSMLLSMLLLAEDSNKIYLERLNAGVEGGKERILVKFNDSNQSQILAIENVFYPQGSSSQLVTERNSRQNPAIDPLTEYKLGKEKPRFIPPSRLKWDVEFALNPVSPERHTVDKVYNLRDIIDKADMEPSESRFDIQYTSSGIKIPETQMSYTEWMELLNELDVSFNSKTIVSIFGQDFVQIPIQSEKATISVVGDDLIVTSNAQNGQALAWIDLNHEGFTAAQLANNTGEISIKDGILSIPISRPGGKELLQKLEQGIKEAELERERILEKLKESRANIDVNDLETKKVYFEDDLYKFFDFDVWPLEELKYNIQNKFSLSPETLNLIEFRKEYLERGGKGDVFCKLLCCVKLKLERDGEIFENNKEFINYALKRYSENGLFIKDLDEQYNYIINQQLDMYCGVVLQEKDSLKKIAYNNKREMFNYLCCKINYEELNKDTFNTGLIDKYLKTLRRTSNTHELISMNYARWLIIDSIQYLYRLKTDFLGEYIASSLKSVMNEDIVLNLIKTDPKCLRLLNEREDRKIIIDSAFVLRAVYAAGIHILKFLPEYEEDKGFMALIKEKGLEEYEPLLFLNPNRTDLHSLSLTELENMRNKLIEQKGTLNLEAELITECASKRNIKLNNEIIRIEQHILNLDHPKLRRLKLEAEKMEIEERFRPLKTQVGLGMKMDVEEISHKDISLTREKIKTEIENEMRKVARVKLILEFGKFHNVQLNISDAHLLLEDGLMFSVMKKYPELFGSVGQYMEKKSYYNIQ